MEVAESLLRKLGVGAVGGKAAEWYSQKYGFKRKIQDNLENLPLSNEWTGDQGPFLGSKGSRTVLRYIPGRYIEFLVEPKGKITRRRLRRERRGCAIEKPMQNLIDLLPNECLWEIFRWVSVAEDRRAMAAVCRRWLSLVATRPLTSQDHSDIVMGTPRLDHDSRELAESTCDCEARDEYGRTDKLSQSVFEDLQEVLELKGATDIKLMAMAAGIANRGGLGELKIRGPCRRVTDFGLSAIGMTCLALRRLSLWHCKNLGDEGLCAIGRGCRQLETLSLWECPRVGDDGIKAIAEGCPYLNDLSLDGCEKVADEGVDAVFLSCRRLKKVTLKNINISDAGLVSLAAQAESVVEITLSGLKNVTEAGFQALGQISSLRRLRTLSVTSCQRFSDNALQLIGEYRKALRVFTMVDCHGVSDWGLELLTKSCSSLGTLRIEGCSGITQVGLKAVLANSAGNLKILTLRNCAEARDNLSTSCESQVACSSLLSLSISNCGGLGDEFLNSIRGSCSSVEKLQLNGLPRLTDRGLEAFIHGSTGCLQKVNLDGCVSITDTGVSAVARHSRNKIRTLGLEGCVNVTDSSLKTLSEYCAGIEELDISKCSITDAGLGELVGRMKRLKRLCLAGCKDVTDVTLQAIGKSGNEKISVLNVRDCLGLSREALDALKTQLPCLDLWGPQYKCGTKMHQFYFEI